jgi:transcriptional regulator with XRE-family HTH domain
MDGQPARLRAFREERGWTQRDVAEHVQRLAWAKHGDHVGVNADMIAKWERGAKGVSAYYRELLALLFGVEPRMLGLRTNPRGPEVAAAVDDLSRGAYQLLDHLGPGAEVIRTRVVQVVKDQIARRRTLLTVMGLLSMSAEDSGDATAAPSGTFDDLSDRYQERYHSSDPVALFTVALAHLDAVSAAARRTTGREQMRLIANQARSATLVGRLSFFDLDDSMAARGHYTLATEAAHEAGDAQQEAAALAHLAFVPASAGASTAALDHLAAARVALADQPHPLISSWVDAIESEVLANAGEHMAALSAIDRAREALSSGAGDDDGPRWFDYYDATRLAGFAGYANLLAGRYDAARAELEEALSLPLAAAKQRSVLLSDLATVHYRDGGLDEACRIAISAVDELAQAGYATGSDRVRSFLRLVHPHASSPAVRTLNERVSSLN